MLATTRNTAHISTRLQRGRALVLTGAQGSGKATLARIIASKHGSYVEIAAQQLDRAITTEAALKTEPFTLVIEGLPDTDDTAVLARIKALITEPQTLLRSRKGSQPRLIQAPNLIFCTSDLAHPFLLEQSRRLTVIHL